MPDEGLWFIREGVERDRLGKWEVWFRPVREGERKHGNFPTRHQALEVVTALNQLSRHGIRPDPDTGPDRAGRAEPEER